MCGLDAPSGDLYPDLFTTVLVPKLPELTASPDRFGGDKQKAKEHFESGFRHAFTALVRKMDPRFPLTVYYAFKQNDEEAGEKEDVQQPGVDLTTGWETLLEALISSGFQITATWPVRASQLANGGDGFKRTRILHRSRLPATSSDAPQIASTHLSPELKRDLPAALRHLQQGNIAPVDFAQAAIGPGMAVYSRYSRFSTASGKPMSVREALRSSIRPSTRSWPSKKTISMPIPAGRSLGSSSTASPKAILAMRRRLQGQDHLRRWASAGGHSCIERRQSAAASPGRTAGRLGPATDHRLTVWEMTHHLLRVL